MRRLFLVIIVPIILFLLSIGIGFSIWTFKDKETVDANGGLSVTGVASVGKINVIDTNLTDNDPNNFKLIIEQDNVYLNNQALVRYKFVPTSDITDISQVEFTFKIALSKEYFDSNSDFYNGPDFYIKPIEDSIYSVNSYNQETIYEGKWTPKATSVANEYEFTSGIGFIYKEGRKPNSVNDMANLQILRNAEIRIEFFATKKVI